MAPSRKAKVKKGAASAESEGIDTCSCPVCYQPLTLTLDIRGADDSDDSDDGEPEQATTTTVRKRKASASIAAIAQVASQDVAGVAPSTREPKQAECRACYERPRDACYLPCGHIVFCMECTGKLQSKTCPLCRKTITRVVKAKEDKPGGAGSPTPGAVTVGRSTILQRLNMAEWQSSSKVEAVAKAVKSMVEGDETDKAICFSQYRTMLDLVEWRLKQAGVRVCKLMGDMPLAERRSVLANFKSDPDIKV